MKFTMVAKIDGKDVLIKDKPFTTMDIDNAQGLLIWMAGQTPEFIRVPLADVVTLHIDQ